MNSQKKLTSPSKRIKVGPWGGKGGALWDDGTHRGIRSITLVYGRCINSIQVEYDKNGKSVTAERHGGNGGSHSLQIKLAYPEEYLTAITGYIGPSITGYFASSLPVIRSLMFKSNKQAFGPYGTEEGTPFELPIEEGMVIGFHGRSGLYLDSIGMHLSRVHTANVYDLVHQKIHKLGAAAYKKLGNKNDHGHAAKAENNKAIA